MPTEQSVLAFIAAINAHDVGRILQLCAPGHTFIDAYGTVVAMDQLAQAWSGYFSFMPSYRIEVETVLCRGSSVAIFGFASGSLDDTDHGRSWRRPAAWRAQVAADRIQLWQVYVDTKIVFDLLAAPKP